MNAVTSQPLTSYSVPYYQQQTSYNYWPYGTTQTPYTGYSYPYGGYYANVPMNGTTQYTPYVYGQQYRGGQLQWQQPYQGPRLGVLPAPGEQTSSNNQTVEPNQAAQEVQNEQVQCLGLSADPKTMETLTTSDSPIVPTSLTENTPATTHTREGSPLTTSSSGNTDATPFSPSPPDSSQQGFTLTSEMEQAILRNLHALSVMQPTQLADLLQSNPQLQAVLAAMDQAKSAAS